MDIPWAAITPFAIILAAFVIYCLYDITQGQVNHLPKWVWALICLFSVPVGAIVYLLIGRDSDDRR